MTERIIYPDEADAGILRARSAQVIGLIASLGAGAEGYRAISTGAPRDIIASGVLASVAFISSRSSIRSRTSVYLKQKQQIEELQKEKDPTQELFEQTVTGLDSSMM